MENHLPGDWPVGAGRTRSELGLTTARRFQGAFGPLVQSMIVVALQTEGNAALVRIFELLAAGADQLEAARECGVWTGHEGAQQFWTESRPSPGAVWKVFGWNFGEGSIILLPSKNEELDSRKIGRLWLGKLWRHNLVWNTVRIGKNSAQPGGA